MSATSSETSARLSNGSNRNALIAWLAIVALLVALGFVGTSTGQTDPDVLYDYSFAGGSAVIYAILVAVTLAIAHSYGDAVGALGLQSTSWWWIWRAVGLIVLVLVLGAVLEPFLHASEKQGFAPDAWRPDRAGAFAINSVIASTVVPFAEELFFRGLGVRVLLPFGGVAAVGVTALAFGLGHGLLVALPVLVPFGLALAWVRWRSDSIWPGVVAHGSYNGIALLVLYLTLAW
jgi:membrane protease YdiL (CAAX protease family)